MNADLERRAGSPGTGAGGHVADRFRRVVEPAVRGVAGVVVTVNWAEVLPASTVTLSGTTALVGSELPSMMNESP